MDGDKGSSDQEVTPKDVPIKWMLIVVFFHTAPRALYPGFLHSRVLDEDMR